MVFKAALLCLALNMYHESRGEPDLAQVAVAYVTINRASGMEIKDPICTTVYTPSAFSWTKRKHKIKEYKELTRCKIISYHVLKKRISNPIGKRRYFNHKSLGKRFKTPYKPIIIGNLIFY